MAAVRTRGCRLQRRLAPGLSDAYKGGLAPATVPNPVVRQSLGHASIHQSTRFAAHDPVGAAAQGVPLLGRPARHGAPQGRRAERRSAP